MAIQPSKTEWECDEANVQQRARPHGNAGIRGNAGIMVSVTYRIQRLAEGANQLNEGTRLLREESERLREQALELDQKWKEAFATAQLACPRITWSRTLEKPPQVEAQRLDEIARRAVQAQVAAEKIEKSLETISWR